MRAKQPGRPSQSLLELIEGAVIFQDRHLLVIDKPSGVAVHGGSGMSFGVIEALRASRPRETLELVHRLDRDTSGCLLVARDRADADALHALIRDGGMHKTYLALVAGSWQLGTKRIDAPLSTDSREHGERHVRVATAGKASVSIFKPVQFFGPLATLMEVGIPDRPHAPDPRPCLLRGASAARRRQIWRSRAQCGTQGLRAEAHLPACAVGCVRLAGVRRTVSRQRAAARRSGRGAGCDHAGQAQDAEAHRAALKLPRR